MKKHLVVMIALLLCLCMGASAASALVIDGPGGVIRRGSYYNGDLSLTLPSSAWEEYSAVSYKDQDEIMFRGAADVNGFIPGIEMLIYDEPWDMDLDFPALQIDDSIRVVNQSFWFDDREVHYDCYFSSDDGSTMELDYIIWFNVGNYGVVMSYFTYSATRSIPDDLPALDDMLLSVAIEGAE